MTNMHVIEDVMNDASKEVGIFNAAIGEYSFTRNQEVSVKRLLS